MSKWYREEKKENECSWCKGIGKVDRRGIIFWKENICTCGACKGLGKYKLYSYYCVKCGECIDGNLVYDLDFACRKEEINILDRMEYCPNCYITTKTGTYERDFIYVEGRNLEDKINLLLKHGYIPIGRIDCRRQAVIKKEFLK